MSRRINLLTPLLPDATARRLRAGRLFGDALPLAAAGTVEGHAGVTVIVTTDPRQAARLEEALGFFLGDTAPVLAFPDWETLPYDIFSPHQDIVSQRIEALYRLPRLTRGVLVVPVTTLMQRLAPRDWLEGNCLIVDRGQRLVRDELCDRLEAAGYRRVPQVMEHGEYTLRGALLDVFPMGSETPFRLDFLDDEIDSIRAFDPETQRSTDRVDNIRLLPGREFPMHESAIREFRTRYRVAIEGDPGRSLVYREVSAGNAFPGIEYYLPLFFDRLDSLFDYLPENTLCITTGEIGDAMREFERETAARHESHRHDRERPILPPEALFLPAADVETRIGAYPLLELSALPHAAGPATDIEFESALLPPLRLDPRAQAPARALASFIDTLAGRVLFTADSPGRREALLDTLRPLGMQPRVVEGWHAFLATDAPLAITVAPLDEGFWLQETHIAVVPETALLGERVRQERRRRPTRDADAVVRNLTDLVPGAPVVHEEHGVGRYLGLTMLDVADSRGEFLAIEYADGAKLYVPVASLHLVSRYTGADPEHAPLHRLGGDQWARIRRRAAEKARDVAAELLDIHARRAARTGHRFRLKPEEYAAFANAFPFEETPDQAKAIAAVIHDMTSGQPMDRVVCGDVGFGKTEVAMRAAFIAALDGTQVAVLVPTTLLAQQHFENFRDRFADWPVRIEMLSRFRTKKEQATALAGLAEGRVDIVIGTHKLLAPEVKFANLGLVIIDEEHRFGVVHKERLKKLRAEVDLLTLTATPIPRTLNMALSGLRDLSIIATPPVARLAVKTFIAQWDDETIREACLRELRRGGQVYFLHNEVETIEKTAERIRKLVPQAQVAVAHGQMRERDLERVMLDFYHRRTNILVCSTIIESGIDVPTANTIIINRADKLGLAQLHQLRGRVGRSHHRAYAWLITPPPGAMTADAVKRLEAISSHDELGVGFTLASHDLEIRGAGELLGEEQSGQIQEIGFTLYNELLERAVKALKSGQVPDLDAPLAHATEVDLGFPALLPDDYVPDVHTRLILYKRIAACPDEAALRDMKVELIDRFGLLPPQAENLIETARLRLKLEPLGVRKLEVGPQGGRVLFHPHPAIDTAGLIRLIQSQPAVYRLDGQDRVRFTLAMATIEQRIQAVLRFIGAIALKPMVA